MPDRPIPNHPLSFLWFATRPFFWPAFVSVLFATIAQLLSTLSPYILKRLVDVLTGSPNTSAVLAGLRWWGGLYIVAILLMFAGVAH